jgi:predicted lipoprotein with Yx(FWY)xxD motif
MRALVLGAAVSLLTLAAADAAPDLFAPATPPGITQEPVVHAAVMQAGIAAGVSGGSFADARGMTLYTYDGDATPGKSSCAGDCAKSWQPLAAPPDAKAAGDWSPIVRDDGVRQWAYRGKPLYLSAGDAQPGDAAGNGADGLWHVARAVADDIATPASVALRPVANALGDVFVDYRGMTLYVFDGDAPGSPACVDSCLKSWTPLAAGALARPSGDWSIAVRADGSRQWSYDGRPLYSYAGDAKPGDAKGAIADPRWRPAALRRYFVPPEVRPRINGRTMVLATADGMTLYARDKFRFSFGGYSVNDGPPATPAIGRAIGAAGCARDCVKTWTPLAAPPDAQPSGFWSIALRDDGARQWAYQGYPVYTNANDRKPGDMLGRDVFDLTDGSNALYWRVVTP